ncbi:MAG: orotidine-5'-phosphate decarboxylase [Dehalococcoidales bacterium]
MNFSEKLNNAVSKNNSLLCIGLDPAPDFFPDAESIVEFNKAIIEATADLVCAYKPNFAFYEAFGAQGFNALKETAAFIPKDIPVIADAKRGDIGNTAKAYARSVFDTLNFDAITVNPYMGSDSVLPFIDYRSKGVFILCRTSNSGSGNFQSLNCGTDDNKIPLFQAVAAKAGEWNEFGNVGLVVGATYPDELQTLRKLHPEMLFLIPGIGAQGGDLETTVRNGIDTNGRGAIINSARQIIYASRGNDFATAARKAAMELRDKINLYR